MRRVRGRCCASLLAGIALSASRSAFARNALSVELELAPCVASDAAGLERVVQAELGSAIAVSAEPEIEAPQTPRADVARVRVTCEDALIELEVQDPVTGKKLSRHLQIPPDLAAARARVLGLSIAELVAASWIELSGTRDSPVRIVEATAPRDARSAALTAAKRGLATNGRGYELTGFASARAWTRDDFTTFGGALAFSWLPRAWLALALDADAGAGTHAVSLGRVHAFLGSAALCPRLRYTLRRWSLEAGVGMRVGLAHFSGVANAALMPVPEEHRATLPWAGPLLALGASVRPVGAFTLDAVLEGGLVSYRAEARVAGQGEFEIAGPWLGLNLGLGFSGLD